MLALENVNMCKSSGKDTVPSSEKKDTLYIVDV